MSGALTAGFNFASGVVHNPLGFFFTSLLGFSALNNAKSAAGKWLNLALAGGLFLAVSSLFPGFFTSIGTAVGGAANSAVGVAKSAVGAVKTTAINSFGALQKFVPTGKFKPLLELIAQGESGGRNVLFGNRPIPPGLNLGQLLDLQNGLPIPTVNGKVGTNAGGPLQFMPKTLSAITKMLGMPLSTPVNDAFWEKAGVGLLEDGPIRIGDFLAGKKTAQQTANDISRIFCSVNNSSGFSSCRGIGVNPERGSISHGAVSSVLNNIKASWNIGLAPQLAQ